MDLVLVARHLADVVHVVEDDQEALGSPGRAGVEAEVDVERVRYGVVSNRAALVERDLGPRRVRRDVAVDDAAQCRTRRRLCVRRKRCADQSEQREQQECDPAARAPRLRPVLEIPSDQAFALVLPSGAIAGSHGPRKSEGSDWIPAVPLSWGASPLDR